MTKGKKTQADVLDILRKSEGPMTAYEILGQMRQDNSKLAPPTIYRALSALTEQGVAHRVESSNAFVACKSGAHDEAAVLAICDDCGSVDEIIDHNIVSHIEAATRTTGFKTTHRVIEVRGACHECAGEGAQS